MIRNQQLQKIEEALKQQRKELVADIEDGGDSAKGGIAYNPDRNDLANEYRSRERRTSLRAMEEQTLQQVEQALAQIEEGTYGRCIECKQPINAERLEILPHATLCVQCQNKETN